MINQQSTAPSNQTSSLRACLNNTPLGNNDASLRGAVPIDPPTQHPQTAELTHGVVGRRRMVLGKATSSSLEDLSCRLGQLPGPGPGLAPHGPPTDALVELEPAAQRGAPVSRAFPPLHPLPHSIVLLPLVCKVLETLAPPPLLPIATSRSGTRPPHH